MSLTTVADVLAACALLAGVALTLLAAVGVLRFPDVLTRMHAATKPQTLGMLLVLVALALRLRDPAVIGMLAAVGLFQLVTAPVSAHMVGRSAYRQGYVSKEHLLADEYEGGRPRPDGDEARRNGVNLDPDG